MLFYIRVLTLIGNLIMGKKSGTSLQNKCWKANENDP